jgi:hypothetical protein
LGPLALCVAPLRVRGVVVVPNQTGIVAVTVSCFAFYRFIGSGSSPCVLYLSVPKLLCSLNFLFMFNYSFYLNYFKIYKVKIFGNIYDIF